ncbi:uncharacterized protein LOC112041517 [Lingula anatina]|uniref:Uncharacterized protein LOC112041517 n=2 Tax=Lingula anatina TaxID=7574 RepID=A0A2R2MK78_LINAN|nr:uncharacterized protein LOC112041517 [Lingula anatina]|eukprot:XP_023930626.1 uncharacterized protein LOC112041517 [Lingula anatina]
MVELSQYLSSSTVEAASTQDKSWLLFTITHRLAQYGEQDKLNMQADLCSCLRVAASLSPYLFYVDELWSSTFTVATLEASVHLINTYVRNFCCEGIVLPWSLTLYFVRGLLSLCSQRSQSLNSAVLNQGFGKSPLIVVSLIMHYPVVEGALGRELCSSHGSSSEHFVIFNRLRSVYMWATELLGQTLSLEPPCPEPWISGAAIFAVCASAGHRYLSLFTEKVHQSLKAPGESFEVLEMCFSCLVAQVTYSTCFSECHQDESYQEAMLTVLTASPSLLTVFSSQHSTVLQTSVFPDYVTRCQCLLVFRILQGASDEQLCGLLAWEQSLFTVLQLYKEMCDLHDDQAEQDVLPGSSYNMALDISQLQSSCGTVDRCISLAPPLSLASLTDSFIQSLDTVLQHRLYQRRKGLNRSSRIGDMDVG